VSGEESYADQESVGQRESWGLVLQVTTDAFDETVFGKAIEQRGDPRTGFERCVRHYARQQRPTGCDLLYPRHLGERITSASTRLDEHNGI
jgi:hypothetical protein